MSRGGKKYLDFPPLSDISLILSGGTAGFRAIFALLRGDCQNPAGQGRGDSFHHPHSMDPKDRHRLTREDGQVRLYPLRPKGFGICPGWTREKPTWSREGFLDFGRTPSERMLSDIFRSVRGVNFLSCPPWTREEPLEPQGFAPHLSICGSHTVVVVKCRSLPPRGRLWVGAVTDTAFIQAEAPFSLYRGGSPTHLSQPAQLGGGPLPTLDTGPQARIQKKRDTPKDIPH